MVDMLDNVIRTYNIWVSCLREQRSCAISATAVPGYQVFDGSPLEQCLWGMC